MFLQIWVTHTHPFSPTNMTPHRSSSTTDVNLGHGYVVKTSANDRAGTIGHDADLHRCDLQSRDSHPRQRRQRLSPCWDRWHWVHTSNSQLRLLGNNTGLRALPTAPHPPRGVSIWLLSICRKVNREHERMKCDR